MLIRHFYFYENEFQDYLQNLFAMIFLNNKIKKDFHWFFIFSPILDIFIFLLFAFFIIFWAEVFLNSSYLIFIVIIVLLFAFVFSLLNNNTEQCFLNIEMYQIKLTNSNECKYYEWSFVLRPDSKLRMYPLDTRTRILI